MTCLSSKIFDILLSMRVGNQKIGGLLGISLIFVVAFYFIYHTVQGEPGILALNRVTKELHQAQEELGALTVEKETLEHKLNLIGDRIDKRLLEVQVRAILGYVHSDEFVVLDPF